YLANYLNGKLQAYLGDSSDLTFGWSLSKRKKDSHGTVTGVTQAATDPTSIQGRDFARKFDVNLGKFYLTYANDLSETSNLMLNLYRFGDHTKFWSSPVKYDAAGRQVTDINAYANDNDYKQIQRGIKGEWRGSGDVWGWMGGIDLRDNSYTNFVRVMRDYKRSPSRFSPVVRAGTVVADNKTKERVYAMYGELKYRPLAELTLTANARFDHIGLKYDDYLPTASAPFLSKSFNVSSWRGGFAYDIGDAAELYGNVSTGFRAPTIRQLFAGDINPTGGTSSNPNLKPERAVNYEIGVRGRMDAFSGLDWDIALFRMERNDYILDVAGQYNFATGTTHQYQNIGGVRNQGVEVSLKTDPSRTLSMNLAYTLLDARFTRYDRFGLVLGNPFNPRPGAHRIVYYNNTGKRVPRVSRQRLFLALHARPWSGMLISGEMDARSSYFADEINQEKIGGYTIFNLVANYDMHLGKRVDVSFFARVDNVLDRFYYNTARGYRDRNNDMVYNAEDLSLVVNPGRRWTAGLTATF
ncbi:MAG: TonB-dependent receptor, partial [Zetaproteobacteria bacterium]